MKGTEYALVQIDGACFAGHRKYNRDCILDGDHAPKEEDEEIVQNNRNHGQRIDGPWVFGLIQGRDVGYFYVEKYNADSYADHQKGGGSWFSDPFQRVARLSTTPANRISP